MSKAEIRAQFGDECLDFLELLTLKYSDRIHELLEDRKLSTVKGFLPETKKIRNSNWKVASPAKQIEDRRVEITGPVSRKMIINALNSGANVFMADFEDSNSPTWENCISGQINLYDAVRRQIDFTSGTTGKKYKLNENIAKLFV